MNLTWTKTLMICAILLSAGFAAYLGANVTVNVNQLVQDAVKEYLERELNSSFYLLQKPCSYIVGMVGSYACLQNGTTGKLDFYSTNATAVLTSAIGNMTNGGTMVKTKTHRPYNVRILEWSRLFKNFLKIEKISELNSEERIKMKAILEQTVLPYLEELNKRI